MRKHLLCTPLHLFPYFGQQVAKVSLSTAAWQYWQMNLYTLVEMVRVCALTVYSRTRTFLLSMILSGLFLLQTVVDLIIVKNTP